MQKMNINMAPLVAVVDDDAFSPKIAGQAD
jgi:hypothetical protein